MELAPFLSSVLPFPVSIDTDVPSPADLHDPSLAEAILEAVAEEALAQGAEEWGAWIYGSLVAEVVTGWAVGADVPQEVLEAFTRAIHPSGAYTARVYLAPSWEEVDREALALALEEAWRVARDLGRGQLFTVREAARRLGVHETYVRRLAREGRLPGARKVGRDWLIPASALAHVRRRRRHA